MPLTMLDELAMYLAAAPYSLGILSGPNQSIFLNWMPDAPNTVIVLYTYGGQPGEGGFGFAGVKDEHPGVQVQVRGANGDSSGPEILIGKVYRALAEIQGKTLQGTTYYYARPQQSPFLSIVTRKLRHESSLP
jgi:hypothetical protein